jgi:ABC-type glycerol-3-phosphate transport system substrate-binding protein
MKHNLSWRALVALLAGLALLVAACGSDDDEGADDDTTTSEAAEETTTSEAAAETTTSEAAEEATTSEAAGGGIGVVLNDEFELVLASDPVAGSVTFNVANEGPDFPHALTIVKGASLDDLPRNEANGAVDTDAMDPADIIGSTSIPLASGTSEDLTVDLEAGDYVFFCPIQNESQSHVGAGQFVNVTVGS